MRDKRWQKKRRQGRGKWRILTDFMVENLDLALLAEASKFPALAPISCNFTV